MDITVRPSDRFRIQTEQSEHFVDVSGAGYQGMKVEAYPHFHYIEVRRKDSQVATFYFKSKRHKKEYDFGWYADAEVVYSVNEVYHRGA